MTNKMKKTTKFILPIAISMLTLAFDACKKPEKGETGPAGKDGSANVISSTTITLNNWVKIYDDSTEFEYYHIIAWDKITQDIKDNGVIMVYAKDDSSWVALPASVAFQSYSTSFIFSVNTGSIRLNMDGYDLEGSPGSANAVNTEGYVIRIVVIPSSGKRKLDEKNIDIKDYEAVQQYLTI